MPVEIRILSGARQGERIVLDVAEFRLGAEPGCEIYFDPLSDSDAQGRVALVQRTAEGWTIRSLGATGLWVNQTPLAREERIRSGDLVRLSEFGPDLSFAVTSGDSGRTAGSTHSAIGQRLTATVVESARSSSAADAVTPETEVQDEGPSDSAEEETPRELPQDLRCAPTSIGSRTGIWAAVGFAIVFLAAVLIGYIPRTAPDNESTAPGGLATAAIEPVEPTPGSGPGPSLTQAEPSSARDAVADQAGRGTDRDRPTSAEAPVSPIVADDPWAHARNELREATLLLQVEIGGPKGGFTWPFATCSAIEDQTLLVTAREAAQLATWHRQGYGIWATSPRTGFRVAIQEFRVHRDFVDLADKPGDWMFANLGLLVTEAKLPSTVRIASAEELAELEEGMPVACFGFSHDGGKITRFDTFEPQIYPARIYLITGDIGPSGSGKVLELQAEFPQNLYGSPIVNRRGNLIGVYGEAAPSDNLVPKNLHYTTALAAGLFRDVLKGSFSDWWVPPPVSEAAHGSPQ